jgi:hypothetical protein
MGRDRSARLCFSEQVGGVIKARNIARKFRHNFGPRCGKITPDTLSLVRVQSSEDDNGGHPPGRADDYRLAASFAFSRLSEGSLFLLREMFSPLVDSFGLLRKMRAEPDENQPKNPAWTASR